MLHNKSTPEKYVLGTWILNAMKIVQPVVSDQIHSVRTITVRKAMLGYICREMERIDWKYGIRIWLDIDNHCYQK